LSANIPNGAARLVMVEVGAAGSKGSFVVAIAMR
jgi:hypothetical protein